MWRDKREGFGSKKSREGKELINKMWKWNADKVVCLFNIKYVKFISIFVNIFVHWDCKTK